MHLKVSGKVSLLGRAGVVKTTKKSQGTTMLLTTRLLFDTLLKQEALERIWMWQDGSESNNLIKETLPKPFT